MASQSELNHRNEPQPQKLSNRTPTELTAARSGDETEDFAMFEEPLPYINNMKDKGAPEKENAVGRKCRNLRLLSMGLGFAALAILTYGVTVILDHKGIRLKKSSPDFETLRSMEDVNLHSEPEDCWMVLDGMVYDLTDYKHPGGMAYIYGRCGRDGTSGFDGTHSRHYLPLVSEFAIGTLQVEEETEESAPSSVSDVEISPVTMPAPMPVPVPVPVPTPETQPVTNTPQASAPTESPEPFCISIEEVELHSFPEDCYYILYGDVFDFTLYIDEHPGGPKHVESECGTDATVMFETAKKHDMDLLQKKKGYDFYLAPAC